MQHFRLALAFTAILAGSSILNADILDHWSLRAQDTQEGTFQDVVYGNGIFVAVGDAYTVMGLPQGWLVLNSLSGVTWGEAPAAPVPLANEVPLNGVTYGAGKFVAVGIFDAAFAAISTNAENWLPATFGLTNMPCGFAVTYGNGSFVSVGSGFGPPGEVAVSPDGFRWTSLTATAAYQLFGTAFGQDHFVAVGWLGTILISTNAVDWQQVPSAAALTLNGVGYGGGKFLAVGESGTILISSDAVEWSQVTTGTTNALQSVAYGGGYYVAVGNNGTILSSSDAREWRLRQSGTTNALLGVAYGNDTFVVVGARRTILQSGTNPFSITFDSVQAHPTGLELRLTGEQGRSFRIEISTNLIEWTEASVVTAPEAGVLYLDANPPTLSQKFYRAVAP